MSKSEGSSDGSDLSFFFSIRYYTYIPAAAFLGSYSHEKSLNLHPRNHRFMTKKTFMCRYTPLILLLYEVGA